MQKRISELWRSITSLCVDELAFTHHLPLTEACLWTKNSTKYITSEIHFIIIAAINAESPVFRCFFFFANVLRTFITGECSVAHSFICIIRYFLWLQTLLAGKLIHAERIIPHQDFVVYIPPMPASYTFHAKKNLHPTEQFDISYTPLWKGHWTYLKTWNDVFLKSFHKRRFWKCRLLFIPQPECRCRSLLTVWTYFRIAWPLFFSAV